MLIDNQQKHLTQCSEMHLREMLGKSCYNKEYKTIGLTVARRCGKTSAIISMCRHDDLIIVPNHRAIYNYRDHLNVINVDQLNCHTFEKFNYIFIDDAESIPREKLQQIYDRTSANWYIKLS